MDVASDIVTSMWIYPLLLPIPIPHIRHLTVFFAYSCEVLTLGLLFLEFKDSIRHGDGDHDMIVWKYFLLIFKACGRKNYVIEALTTLTQYHITLPPQLAD